MTTNNGTKILRGLTALLALGAVASACGMEDGAAPEPGAGPQLGANETLSSNLSANVPYLSGRLTARSNTAGDAAVFKGKAYFAYVTPSSTIAVVTDDYLNTAGQDPQTFGFPTSATFGGPALLPLGNTLYLFYISGTALVMQRSNDGATWDGPSIIATPKYNAWTTPPVAVAWDGAPHVFVAQGGAGWPSMITQYTISGTTAQGPTSVPPLGQTVTTNSRPSVTVWNGALYLAFADGYYNQIAMMHFTDAAGWSAETLTGKTGIPAIHSIPAGSLELVYRASDTHIYHALSQNGTSFSASTEDLASTTNHAAVPFYTFNTQANWVFYIGIDNELFTVPE